jgi:hypothetical protein
LFRAAVRVEMDRSHRVIWHGSSLSLADSIHPSNEWA